MQFLTGLYARAILFRPPIELGEKGEAEKTPFALWISLSTSQFQSTSLASNPAFREKGGAGVVYRGSRGHAMMNMVGNNRNRINL